jgi:triosephosphate isomerase
MPKKIVAGNWKMNTSLEDAKQLAKSLKENSLQDTSSKLVVCPPFVWIHAVSEILRDTNISVGAQNCAASASGAFTGEVSASMLKELGVEYVILGHSERRAMFGDTDAVILEKCKQALAADLQIIFCCGETLAEREAGKLENVLTTQLSAVLKGIDQLTSANLVIAYEPVWAIGTGLTATPEQAESAHGFIRNLLVEILGNEVGLEISLLYGGSCNATNAASLFEKDNIDGGLIGGASLKSTDFLKIGNSW